LVLLRGVAGRGGSGEVLDERHRRSLTPSLTEARRLAREYDVVPLYAELIGDLETPISPH
jgi:hypothetical protein